MNSHKDFFTTLSPLFLTLFASCSLLQSHRYQLVPCFHLTPFLYIVPGVEVGQLTYPYFSHLNLCPLFRAVFLTILRHPHPSGDIQIHIYICIYTLSSLARLSVPCQRRGQKTHPGSQHPGQFPAYCFKTSP